MSLKDNAYQKYVAQKKIDGLTSFLEDIQCLQGNHIKKTNSHKALDRMLYEAAASKEIDLDSDLDTEMGSQDDEEGDDSTDAVDELADKKQGDDEADDFYIGSNQRYFMGAGTDPLLTIITQVGDDKIKYYQYPWKKEQVINKDIGRDLLMTGCKTWLDKNQDTSEEDLKKSIESVLHGQPGEKVTLEDYQFANIQVRYTGTEKGDDAPWKELEQKYNVNVGGVLTNKQTYNIRLTNRALQKFEDELRQAEPEDRNFKIVKIMKEEQDPASYLMECMGIYPGIKTFKPKMIVRDIEPESLEWMKKLVESGARNTSTGAGDYSIGETISFQDSEWIVAEFISWTKDPLVMLVNIDFTKMADMVPLKKIRKLNPEEITRLQTREELITGKKEVTLEFPTSKGDGLTQDIAKEVKGKKKLDEGIMDFIKGKKKPEAPDCETCKGKGYTDPTHKCAACRGTGKKGGVGPVKDAVIDMKEDLVEDLSEFINNDADTYKKDFAPTAKNLTAKWNNDQYNRDLALKSFKQIAESATKRFYVANDGEYEGKNYTDPKQMFPEEVVTKVALILRKSFENQAKSGTITEAIDRMVRNKKPADQEDGDMTTEKSDQLTIGAFHENDKEPIKGSTSTVKEGVNFTQKEKDFFKKANTKIKTDVQNNVVTISWEDQNGLVKVTLTKTPQPQQKTSVYSAKATVDGQLDKDRTKDSEAFETEDDVDILESFLAELNLEGGDQLNEEKAVSKTVTKTVGSYPTKDGKAIKSEVRGTTRFRYITKKDKASQTKKRHLEREKKKITVKKPANKIKKKLLKPQLQKTSQQPTKKKSLKEESTLSVKDINNNAARLLYNGKEIIAKRFSTINLGGKEWFVYDIINQPDDQAVSLLEKKEEGYEGPVKIVIASTEEPIEI